MVWLWVRLQCSMLSSQIWLWAGQSVLWLATKGSVSVGPLAWTSMPPSDLSLAKRSKPPALVSSQVAVLVVTAGS